jgi:lysophospholipase L1-like esterase
MSRSESVFLRRAWKRASKLLLLIMAVTFLAAAGSARAAEKDGNALPARSRRILFLGDSITYDGRYVTYFEAWLAARFRDTAPEVINAGLPSETVSGLTEEGHADGLFPRPCLHERLERVLGAIKPDLIIACYGMNCGIYQPFDEERFAEYREGIEKLREAARDAAADIVFMTPPVFDHKNAPWADAGYNSVLTRYSAWLRAQRDAAWNVISLHRPMSRALEAERAADAAFTFQQDGVHPGDAGHWFMARRLIQYFGGSEDAFDAATPEAMVKALNADPAILPLLRNRMVCLRGAWLSHTGHKRPGLPAGLPLEKAREEVRTVSRKIAALLAAVPARRGDG